MSKETGDAMSLAPDAQRPLPPAIKFDSVSGTFSGTATPGLSVRLTSSAAAQMRSATVDADGEWTIALGKQRWYTIFKIWTCDPATGAASEKVQFTFGGSGPKLEEVYASQTVAFGRAGAGTEISVFGPTGKVLGRSFAFGKLGVWTVRFREELDAGDTVCIVAKLPNGNTSMPLFTEAKSFSVGERNVAHVAGSGADLGDRIRLFDLASMQQIAETAATDTGSWSISFCNLLEAGKRIAVQRIHENGLTSEGPIFTATKNECLAPIIEQYSYGQLAGTATPGLRVSYTQYRNNESILSGTVTADATSFWSSNDAAGGAPVTFETGDIFVATTSSSDGTEESVISSNITYGESRPGAPLIETIDQNSASGWAEPHKFVVASAANTGVICAGRTTWEGHWYLDWADFVGPLPKTTLVVFEVFDSLQLHMDAPTSTSSAQYADSAAVYPDVPTIDIYTGTEIGGEEDTPTSFVRVVNDATGEIINNAGAKPDASNRWKVTPADAIIPPNGTKIYAKAWFSQNNQFTVASNPSSTVTIDTYIPPNPLISTAHPSEFIGTEPVAIGDVGEIPKITVYFAPDDGTHASIGDTGHLASTNWTFNPAPPRTAGEKMIAWAKTDAGEVSGDSPFTVAALAVPVPPEITQFSTAKIQGTGATGTTVALYLNGIQQGTTLVQADFSWTITLGSAPASGDKLHAIATDNTTGGVSDLFYALGGDKATFLVMNELGITTKSATGSVTDANQTLFGWRIIDGLKVMEFPLPGSGAFTAQYLPTVTISAGDQIKFTAQDTAVDPTEGTMCPYDGKAVL